jgi:hypothetical protein
VKANGRTINAENFLARPGCLPAHWPQFFASSTLADRWKEFRENRKQLRCCNWIQLLNGQSLDMPAVKAGRRMAGDRAFLRNAGIPPEARSQNISPTCSHSRRPGAQRSIAASAERRVKTSSQKEE